MGWKVHVAGSGAGGITLGNWRAYYNIADDSIDIEHTSVGIPHVYDDTTFTAGTKTYTEVSAGKLQIEQWPGWADTIAQDETYTLDDTTTWDDATTNGDALINYMLGATTTTQSYEGTAIFESSAVLLTEVGKYYSSVIDWVVATQPVGTTVAVYSSVYDGSSWSAWAAETSGTAIDALPTASADISSYRLKYKVVLGTNSTGETATISEVKFTVNSQRHVRIMGDGVYKESQHMIDSIPSATTETLTTG